MEYYLGLESIPSFRIYVIKGDDCVLYIGKSQDAITRMESHIGKGVWASFFGSTVDYLLITPQANEYSVELYDENEIAQLHKTIYPNSMYHQSNAIGNAIVSDAIVSDIEEIMIYELAPVFNTIHNRSGKRHNRDRWYALHPEETYCIDPG